MIVNLSKQEMTKIIAYVESPYNFMRPSKVLKKAVEKLKSKLAEIEINSKIRTK